MDHATTCPVFTAAPLLYSQASRLGIRYAVVASEIYGVSVAVAMQVRKAATAKP